MNPTVSCLMRGPEPHRLAVEARAGVRVSCSSCAWKDGRGEGVERNPQLLLKLVETGLSPVADA
jgi:hypothetical protein